jgi:FAD/FMN-containing dehydrogenase
MVDGRGAVRDSRDDGALLWACRGGGNGNFGIVTEMRFETRPAPVRLPRQRIRFRSLTAGRAVQLCERWFTQTARLPDDAFSAFVLNSGTLTVLITWFEPGSAAQVQRVTDAMAHGADSVADPANEPLARAVQRYYGAEGPLHFKNASAGYYRGFDDLRDGIEGVFRSVIDGRGMVFQINTLGGAIDDPAKAASAAYVHRGLPYLGELQCYWERDSQTEDRVARVEAVQRQLRDMGIDRHYRNYPSRFFEDWAHAYYGDDTYRGLQWCKNAYDPDDRIGHAQSVRA